MTSVDDPAPSVRVEFGDTGLGSDTPSIEPVEPKGGASGKRALVIATVALLAVVGLIAALAPNSGDTAAGTPITTTTIAPEPTPSTVASNADGAVEVEDVTTTPQETDPLALYESAESPFLAFNVVAADFGWFVHGFDNEAQEGGLYRSQDGLHWDRLDLRDVATGLVVGFERVGDGYVVAIDERSSWKDSNETDLASRGYEISFWESPDAANWVPATNRPSVSGAGFPYPVKLSESATIVPVLGPSNAESLGGLIDYLSGVMSAELAQQVCGATTRLVPETEVEQIIFRDCEGEVLVEVEGDAASGLINTNGPTVSICIDQLRSFGQESPSFRFFGLDGTTANVSLDRNSALFGELVGSTFVSARPPGSGNRAQVGCGGTIDEQADGGVLLWDEGDGLRLIQLPGVSDEISFIGIAVAEDGRAYTAGESAVLAAQPPYTQWESLAIGDVADEPEGGPRRISVAPDASVFMATDGNEWFFARPGQDAWTQVEVRSRDFGNVLLASDDFVIVEVQRGQSTLVKVPLS